MSLDKGLDDDAGGGPPVNVQVRAPTPVPSPPSASRSPPRRPSSPRAAPPPVQDFERVMVNMFGFDPTLATFKGEYAKLLGALKGSLAVEKKLVKKVGELNEELVANAARVAQALRMSEEDGATIDDLKAQVERAWGLVEAANTRAEAATQEVERLSAETASQRETLARHQELIGEGASLEDIVATRDSLNARLLDAQKGLVGEKARSEGLVAELAARSEKLKAKREEIRGLNDTLAAKGMEDAKKDRQLASMQADMSALKAEAGEKSSAVDAAERAKASAQREQERLQKALDGQKAANTAALSEATELRGALAKARDEAAALVERAGKLGEERAGLEKALKAASGEAVKERAAAAKMAKKLELAEKEVAQQKNLTSGANEELSKLRAEVQSAGRELLQEQLAVKDKERAVAKLNTQKGAAEARADAEAAKKEEVELSVAALAAQVAALNVEAKALKTALIKQRMVAESFERAAARREAEREEAKAACAEAEEALAMRATQVGEMEKREDELNAKLRASHASFDAMRAERNAALKSAGAASDEVKELERREGVTHKQMQHLKQEVMEKDKALINEQFEVSALTKRANTRSAECAQLRKLLDDASETIKRQGDDVDRLTASLRRADAEAVAQKRAFDSLLTERDTLSAHLTRRNDELVLTNEKATVQAAALAKGEKLYDARAEEVRTLKLKVRCGARGWLRGAGGRLAVSGPPAPLFTGVSLLPPPPVPSPPTQHTHTHTHALSGCRVPAGAADCGRGQRGAARGNQAAAGGPAAGPLRGAEQGEDALHGAGEPRQRAPLAQAGGHGPRNGGPAAAPRHGAEEADPAHGGGGGEGAAACGEGPAACRGARARGAGQHGQGAGRAAVQRAAPARGAHAPAKGGGVGGQHVPGAGCGGKV